ncbi:PH domain-containing protein [Nocardiopsis sp. CT-R113]|uniref:PH domain-containing protein n=1 Tax=Nocardiopsis codii TaxID=3065942 RepID=A0ABU7KF34_9ACTN|nr:PH domain-containing protein [Nocardiopsis sp. CT-R113]MEE2040514.1 PH domain-containing protein [Nocardiopsis sp. CT-R113]
MNPPDDNGRPPRENAPGPPPPPADLPAHDGSPDAGQAAGAQTRSPAGADGADTPESEGWQGLHPLSVWANALVVGAFLFFAAIVAIVVLVVVGQALWGLAVFGGTLALFGLLTYLDLLGLRATRYRVTAERIEMRSGIIAKAYRSVPRERVRSVDVAAPLYARVLGLCSVTVGTGEKVAEGAEQFQLTYVTAGQGESLRRELLYRGAPRPAGSTAADGGSPSAEDGEFEVELARLDRRWFAFAPVTTATVGIGLGVIVTLLGANAQANGAPWRWISDRANLPSGEEMASFVVSQVLLVAPLALLGLLVSGVLIVTAVAVETWWDYRLTRDADGTVRLRRGLLTSVSLSVEGRRLNGVTLHEPFLLRSAGGADVRAVATGLGSADDEAAKAKSRLSPSMPRRLARGLAADLMQTQDSPLDAPLNAHPRAALRRRFTRAGYVTVLALVLAGALAWLHTLASAAWWEAARRIEEYIMPVPLAVRAAETAPTWGWAVAAVLAGAAAFWYALGSYRGLGHGLHPRYLVVRQGMAVRRTVTLERSAVIGWRITRSPFQRRLGLADVAATTAAGAGTYAAVDVGLGEGLAWADEAVPGLLAPFLVRGGDGGPEGGDGAPGPL